jgi:hypothetical protein
MNQRFISYACSTAFQLTLSKNQIEMLMNMRAWHDYYVTRAARSAIELARDPEKAARWRSHNIEPSGPSYYFKWYARGTLNSLMNRGLVRFVDEAEQKRDHVGDILLTDEGILVTELLWRAGHERIQITESYGMTPYTDPPTTIQVRRELDGQVHNQDGHDAGAHGARVEVGAVRERPGGDGVRGPGGWEPVVPRHGQHT